MGIVKISGYDVLVDDEDMERINQRHWYLNQATLRKHGLHYFYNDIVRMKKKAKELLGDKARLNFPEGLNNA